MQITPSRGPFIALLLSLVAGGTLDCPCAIVFSAPPIAPGLGSHGAVATCRQNQGRQWPYEFAWRNSDVTIKLVQFVHTWLPHRGTPA